MFYVGTILDGEFVRKTYPDGGSKLMYLIFDCLCIDEKSTMDRTLDIGIKRCESCIYRIWKELRGQFLADGAQLPFHLIQRKMQLPYAINFMFDEILPKLPHGNGGLISACKTTLYVSGTDQHILRWKLPYEKTIYFRLRIVTFPMTEDSDGEYDGWVSKHEIELLAHHGDKDR
nr:hypothetical protein B0A51_18913 [Rachicladosporium sp. CCFEE 5018]